MFAILLQASNTPEPTFIWALIGAIAAMATTIGVLYKKNNDQRDKTEQYLLSTNKDMQLLLKETLVQFSEVERQLVAIGVQQTERLTAVLIEGQNKIIEGIRTMIDKNQLDKKQN